MTAKRTDRVEQIVAWVRANPGRTATELEHAIGGKEAAFRAALRQATTDRLVIAVLRGCTKRWFVPEACPPPRGPSDDPHIPTGHELAGLSTLVGPDGEIQAAWEKTRVAGGEPAPLPAGFDQPSRIARQSRGDGSVVTEWRTYDRDKQAEQAAAIEAIKGHVEAMAQPIPEIPTPGDRASDLITIYPLGDPHIGLLAWAPEVGEHFDVKIASRELAQCVTSLVDRSPPSDTAIVAELGDFFHSQDDNQLTPRAGHKLDVDGRFARTARLGLDLYAGLLRAALAKHTSVIARFIPGNHDLSLTFWLAETIRREFKDQPRLTVCDAFSPYQFDRFGRVMLMWAHTDGATIERLAEIAAADEPEMWGATRFRYAHGGHIHSKKLIERPGMIAENHRTLAGRDAWANWRGYRSGRSLQAITYHRAWGEDSRVIEGVERVRAAIEAAK